MENIQIILKCSSIKWLTNKNYIIISKLKNKLKFNE